MANRLYIKIQLDFKTDKLYCFLLHSITKRTRVRRKKSLYWIDMPGYNYSNLFFNMPKIE
jgi:hypothetical protein